MFGSEVLDVAIGLTLVFVMLSLVASAVREAVEGFTKSRAVHLERGIRELLDDPEGTGLARSLYEHPLVYALFRGTYVPKGTRRLGRGMPAYIPARNFAVALLDLAVRGPDTSVYTAQQTAPRRTVDELRASVQRMDSPFVQRALLAAIDSADGDVARVQANVEAWFDSAMDRVSGWYKRRTQLYLFVIALAVTLALNVNTVVIANHLWSNKAAREALARQADVVARGNLPPPTVGDDSAAAAARARAEDLASLDLPIGWDRAHGPPAAGAPWFSYWAAQLLGLFLTAVAVTLGAPFWFDVLNKVMVIRSTVKPHEKSPEEASEDRQRPAPASQPAAGGAGAAGSAVVGTPTGAGTPTAAEVRPPFAPQQWATGDPDEGII